MMLELLELLDRNGGHNLTYHRNRKNQEFLLGK